MRKLVIVTDLDGTLWGANQLCHPATISSLKKLQENNIEVIAATARKRESTLAGFNLNKIVCPAIMLNGSIGIDFIENNIFLKKYFSQSIAIKILSLLSKLDVYFNTYCIEDDKDFDSKSQYFSLTNIASIGIHKLNKNQSLLIKELIPREIAICMINLDIRTHTYSLIIQPLHTSKAKGLNVYLKSKEIVDPYIVAVGNGENDIDILKIADLAVICKSSEKALFKYNDIIIDDPEHGGWAEIVQILNKTLDCSIS